jgi:hypothetical protein
MISRTFVQQGAVLVGLAYSAPTLDPPSLVLFFLLVIFRSISFRALNATPGQLDYQIEDQTSYLFLDNTRYPPHDFQK